MPRYFDGVSAWDIIFPSPTRLDNLQQPFSAFCWVYPYLTAPGPSVRRWFTINAAGLDIFTMRSQSGEAYAHFRDAGNNVRSIFADVIVDQAWNAFAATYDGTTFRFYLNGTEVGTNAVSGNLYNSVISSLSVSSTSERHNGHVAEVGVWNALLTADELLALARGVPPSRVRPNALRFYAPLWGGSPEPELTGNPAGVVTGATVPTDKMPPMSPYVVQRDAFESAVPATPQFKVKKGTITSPGVTGNQPYSGVGFQPKAIIFWVTEQTAEGFAAHGRFGVGFAVGSGAGNNRGVTAATEDNVATSQAARAFADNCVPLIKGASVFGRLTARLVTFDSDGFTLNWTNVNAGAGVIVHYLALGGTELTNVKVGEVAMPTSTGDLTVTGVGFQPDFLMILSSSQTTVNTPVADFAKISVGFGVLSPAIKQGCIVVTARNGTAVAGSLDAARAYRSNAILEGLSDDGTADEFRASVSAVGFDGYTLNFSTAPASAYKFLYLALKGGKYDVTTVGKPLGASPVEQTVSTGFRPSGVLLMSTRQSAAGFGNDWELSFGGTDGVSAGATWVEEQDAVINTESNQSTVTGKAMRTATGPSTEHAAAGIPAFDTNGFSLIWNPNDSASHRIIYASFGDAPVVAPPPNPWSRMRRIFPAAYSQIDEKELTELYAM